MTTGRAYHACCPVHLCRSKQIPQLQTCAMTRQRYQTDTVHTARHHKFNVRTLRHAWHALVDSCTQPPVANERSKRWTLHNRSWHAGSKSLSLPLLKQCSPGQPRVLSAVLMRICSSCALSNTPRTQSRSSTYPQPHELLPVAATRATQLMALMICNSGLLPRPNRISSVHMHNQA